MTEKKAVMNNQEIFDQLVGQIKFQVMMLLNDVSDELDKEMNEPAVREAYNQLQGMLGKKLLEARFVLDEHR